VLIYYMIRFIKSLPFFIISLLFPVSAFSQNQTDTWSQVRVASPVFEEMLTNQITSFRRTITQDKLKQNESSFVVIEADPSEFSKVIPSLNQAKEESFVVALAFHSDRVQLEAIAGQFGFSLSEAVPVPELEFAKDESGRQIVNLDDPKYEYQIYERLVREGLNPVEAHPYARQAIEHLRQMDNIQVLFFTKSFGNQPEKP
jgi:hypothetical protein